MTFDSWEEVDEAAEQMRKQGFSCYAHARRHIEYTKYVVIVTGYTWQARGD